MTLGALRAIALIAGFFWLLFAGLWMLFDAGFWWSAGIALGSLAAATIVILTGVAWANWPKR